MNAKNLGTAALAMLCATTLVTSSCGGGGPGGSRDLAVDFEPQTRGGAMGWQGELDQLRNAPVVFADSASVGALPGRSWQDDGGGGHYSIPIDVSPGPNGHAPSLNLHYSSTSGNGVFGVGFSVAATPMVTRCQKTLAKDGEYEALTMGQHDPICYGGQRLVLSQGDYGAPGSTGCGSHADHAALRTTRWSGRSVS